MLGLALPASARLESPLLGTTRRQRRPTSATSFNPDLMSALPFAASDSPTHDAGLSYRTTALPVSSPPISPATAFRGGAGHKRTLSRSDGSSDDVEDGSEARKKPPGVKRACNDCRQQKLRCDVVQMPIYKSCSRCKRLKLDCKIDSSFKRVGKRSRNMEMEKEIQELRRQLATQKSSPPTSAAPSSIKAAPSDTASPRISSIPSQLDQYINSEEAVNSLLDLRSGIDGVSQPRNVNGTMRPARRLEGITLSHEQIQDLFYRTSKDPTFMLNGLMMQIAMQIGLHRPSHAQDFARFKVEFREEELKDRVKTWVACNMISQRVATGYGQPPSTVYDWTLVPSGWNETNFQIPEDVEARLRIERFCNQVTRSFYTNRMDPVGLVSDDQRAVMSDFMARDLEEIEVKLQPDASVITYLYLRAAGLHFRLSAFFDSPDSAEYHSHLFSLWQSTSSFLECIFDLDKTAGGLLPHASNYILQMIIAAGFALLKLLNSFFADKVKLAYGRELFTKTIQAIRTISVATNDLPSRLAEVLAQLWKSGGSGLRKQHVRSDWMENSLQLKAKGRGNLETAVKNPTNPDSNVESSASSTVDAGLPSQGLLGDAFPASSSNLFGETNNEVFDPLSWMLDGYVNFPFDVSETPGMG
ncbi:MAG: hypothetical protein Q9170_007451 [Blastenia crenularia]